MNMTLNHNTQPLDVIFGIQVEHGYHYEAFHHMNGSQSIGHG